LLVAGGVDCLFLFFLTVMTASFAADPVHDFRSLATMCFLYVALSSVVIFLLMFRWSGIGSAAMWSATACCLLVGLFGGVLPHLLGVLLLMLIEALICQAISSGSRDDGNSSVDS
jgi:hypothetical protein